MSSFTDRRAVALKDMAKQLDDETLVIGTIDLDAIEEQIADLKQAFPESDSQAVLHTVAAKAVPLRALLRVYADAGVGCEAASRGELEVAISVGFPAENIVFDSPAKTRSDLQRAFELGVSINVDNFGELDLLAELIEAAGGSESTASNSKARRLGIRINPQTGGGTIDAMSTATKSSKFGVGLKDEGVREQLLAAYERFPWLNQLHVHSGSQGLSLEHSAQGILAIVELAEEINARVGARQVTSLDIGGGLSVNFDGDEITPTYAEYAEELRRTVPGLGDFDIMTEFGRSLAAKAGTIITRVEHTKTVGGQRIAATHAGVQVATRTVFMPDAWPLRILALNPDGTAKDAPLVSQDVAGPACFAGDLLARGRELPELEAGDLIAVPDTGAYYFSTHFSYNLLPRVPVYGYRVGADGTAQWWTLREGQTLEQLLVEAGPTAPQPIS